MPSDLTLAATARSRTTRPRLAVLLTTYGDGSHGMAIVNNFLEGLDFGVHVDASRCDAVAMHLMEIAADGVIGGQTLAFRWPPNTMSPCSTLLLLRSVEVAANWTSTAWSSSVNTVPGPQTSADGCCTCAVRSSTRSSVASAKRVDPFPCSTRRNSAGIGHGRNTCGPRSRNSTFHSWRAAACRGRHSIHQSRSRTATSSTTWS